MSKPQREETPPEWLTPSFMENSLRKGFKNEEFKVLGWDLKMATTVGDNYGSQMFRITLTVKPKQDSKEEQLSVIVKAIPPGRIGDQLRKLSAFEKEEEAFSKTLPAINALLQRAYPDHQKLWADCYYCQGPPNNLLIFEDLKLSGFVLGSRFEGLDMEHSVLVLRSLAKLHAASIVLRKEDPKSLEMYEKNFWNPDNTEAVTNMFTAPFRILSEEVLEWEGFENKELYSKKLKQMEEDSINRVFKIWTRDENKFNVLLHGDSWVNNFMFKYDPTGKLLGINFVDFQLMNSNSPTLDLQYFIFTSVSPKLRFDNVDFFLKTYYETFEETLKRLDHTLDTPYSFERLKKDFEDHYAWGFIVFCTIFPLFVLPVQEVLHPDSFFESEKGSSFERTYKRSDLREILKVGFPYFLEKGAF